MSKFVNLGLIVASLTTLAASTPVKAQGVTRCQIQPRSNQPSPLAMRAGLDVEEKDGNVMFKYANFPSAVNAEEPPVTIAQERTMIFYKTTLAAARERMVKNPKLFNELVGFEEEQGFKPFNDLLVCQSSGASQTKPTIASLPDGSYRFWDRPASMSVTDQQILEGATTFIFTKTGDRIVGFFARPSDYSMCMTGTAKGNTITGVINPPARFSSNPVRLQNSAFDPGGYLKLGAWSDRGNLGSYSPSTIDLSKFNRINLGPRKAPTLCR